MCRMIFAAGDFELSQLIDNLILMAKGENELHENNPELGTYQHAHGWGIAYLDQGEWIVKKSEKAVFEDSEINELRTVKTNLAVLHVRRATNGVISYDNTHPFQFRNYVFCHNGTLRGKIDYDQWFHVDGKTDSEKLFYSVLTEIKEDYDDYDENKKLECPICNWQGSAKESQNINTDSHFCMDVSCPICDKMLLVVNYAQIKS